MSYVKVRHGCTRLHYDGCWVSGPWHAIWECVACGTKSRPHYSNFPAVVAAAHHHSRTCPAIAIAVDRDKLARRVQRLQTAMDRLTAATILPDTPPC